MYYVATKTDLDKLCFKTAIDESNFEKELKEEYEQK